MEKIKNFFKKEKTNLIILSLILILAAFLRLYNFEEWFYFKDDQARDAYAASAVLDSGPGELRLLGPKAGGSSLHLGPIYYYFQSFSAWVFQSKEPFVMAYPDLISSLLTIPLLYFFIRNFFSNKVSFLLVIIWSFSYTTFQYSRFAWNPNPLFFWGLLTVFSIYNATILKNKTKAGWFLMLAFFSYSVASQLHFIALLGLPIMTGIFWLKFFPKKIKTSFWVLAFLTSLLVYLPVFANEFLTSGNNTQHFFCAVKDRSAKEKTVFDKVLKTGKNYGEFYSFFITSFNRKEVAGVRILGFLFLLISLWFLFRNYKKAANEKNKEKEVFLFLIFACFAAFLLINYKIAFELDRSRYWFVHFFIPFIFLGLFFEYFFSKNNKTLNITGWLVFSALMLFHLTAISNLLINFSAGSDLKNFNRISTSKTNKLMDLVTLSDMKKAIQFIDENHTKDKEICLNSPNGYSAAYKYIFELQYGKGLLKRKNGFIEPAERAGCDLFLVIHKERDEKEIEDILEMKTFVEKRSKFGSVEVLKMLPIENLDKSDDLKKEENDNNLNSKDEKSSNKPEVLPKKKWKDLFE